jgi:pimeloyl-ACP methyl ester carboxylesterase
VKSSADSGDRPDLADLPDLHVEVLGPSAGHPVLLIHGSTETGHHDFVESSDLAARLVRAGYRVILPDCPGHGRSAAVLREDGSLVYSFAQMAEALAGLLPVIGVKQGAHIIGHSNGGTVALYLARFHASAVDRVVCLAGNAYIDERVRIGVPMGMDPDRIDRERPEWRDDMIALHDAHHGPGYWRELVQATINETITNPSWTAADVAPCLVSVLAIQGANDGVNTPGRHAQTIGDWFPNGECWIAEEAGHSVHWEQPDAFERRVLQFFAR